MEHSNQSPLWKLALAAALIALFAGAASAQVPAINLAPGDRPLTQEEKDKQQAREEAYKSALQKIPNKDDKKPVDPWANMRSDRASSPKTK